MFCYLRTSTTEIQFTSVPMNTLVCLRGWYRWHWTFNICIN